MNLCPAPRQIERGGETFPLNNGLLIAIDHPQPQELLFSAARIRQALHRLHHLDWEVIAGKKAPPAVTGLALRVDPQAVAPAQGYTLSFGAGGISLCGHDAAGVFYGACTLIQALEQAGVRGDGKACLPAFEATDWPDFPTRGVMLDISRDKVPTMDTLYALVDRLAGWKINQLQLYMEHTFAYRGHPEVWAQASPLTGEEILALDAYCRERFVELVPNQNSFGHMERWLKYGRYRPLAEVCEEPSPEMADAPKSLCPLDPGSLELVAGLYDELLPNFSSRMVNVGCDETFDLGQGRSKEACAREGAGAVYLEFLLAIHQEVKKRGRTMQFWADMVLEHPELISRLPQDLVSLIWGYEADAPFETACSRLAQAGIPFYVCPGTSSWGSLAGRVENSLGNLRNAAGNGLKYGAAGYLITDWGDGGHWQPLPVSYLGFLAGAAYAWCWKANQSLEPVEALNRHVFQDPTGLTGRVACELGNLYRRFDTVWPNSSALFNVMQRDRARIQKMRGISPANFREILGVLEDAACLLEAGQPSGMEADTIRSEYALVIRMLRHASWRGLLVLEAGGLADDEMRRRLDLDLDLLCDEFSQAWLKRNRPGGLADSLARLEKARRDYQPMESS